MAITSRVPLSLGLGEMTIADWQASGLLKASAIKPVIATLEQALVLRPLGTLQPPDVARLRDVLASLLQ
jgi:mRNA interferase MazF